MFCKHFIKIFVGVPSFNGETSRMGGCEVRGAHSIFLIKNMKSATAFCPDRLCFGDSASCYLSLWNTVAVHIFYSEHTVYFPAPLCCARSMVELCAIQKALHKGELFWSCLFFSYSSGLHMLRGMLLRAGRRRMYS